MKNVIAVPDDIDEDVETASMVLPTSGQRVAIKQSSLQRSVSHGCVIILVHFKSSAC
jgi:hypothetical protein